MQEQQRREKAQLKQLKQPEKEQEQERRAKSAAKELQKEGKRLGKMPSVDAAAAPEGESWDTTPDEDRPDGTEASRARARARARLSSKGARTTAGATGLASRSVKAD